MVVVSDNKAGEMLVSAEPFISANIHPTVIVRAYYKALESALHICEELATPIDLHDRAMMLKLLNSAIGTKFSSRFGDLIVRTSVCVVMRRAAWLWTAC